MVNFTYTVDDENIIRIWDGVNNDGPLIIQPTHPDGTSFANRQSAEDWAETWIANWHIEMQKSLEAEEKRQSAITQLRNAGFSEEEILKIIK
jgi:hypothetical protein